ncbi:MAG: transcription antitermination factor NusB [Puniceicoccales bacterium]|nr:transcription antitermination factor NusB [Puniceicoccales bacterium]
MDDMTGDFKEIVSRRDNRTLAMQLIYAHDISPERPFDVLWNEILHMLNVDNLSESYNFARALCEGTIFHRSEIDSRLQSFLANWNFCRLTKVDLAILRMAFFEMLYFSDDVPAVVTINEAIELGKQYSSDDSRRIINGILDQLRRHLQVDEKTRL